MTAPLPGSLADLAALAGDRPIYITAPFGFSPRHLDAIVARWRRRQPDAVFEPAWGGFYSSLQDWRIRWPRERDRYGALIVITYDPSPEEAFDRAFAEWRSSEPSIPKGERRNNAALRDWRRREPRVDAFFRGAGQSHVVGAGCAQEIEDLDRLGRGVGWLALEGPLGTFTFWRSRFAVEPIEPCSAGSFARLLPASDAAPFRPVIGDLLFRDLGIRRQPPGIGLAEPAEGRF
jgi:hypothetical protein